MRVLVATSEEVLSVDPDNGGIIRTEGLTDPRPTCLAADPLAPRRVWCGTARGGVFRSDDAGLHWAAAGLAAERIMAVAASPVERDRVWAGTEPSAIRSSRDGGRNWQNARELVDLPSSPTWSFPPKPDTHHVRWIACHPARSGKLWVAIEAGALVRTEDGGETWIDRAAGGPWDTHELAVHPEAPDTLRIAAGDGYFESHDAGATWASPDDGLDVGYLRSVAIDPGDPECVVVSAATHPHAAYRAGSSDGRLFRREGRGSWVWVTEGWPAPPNTIAPLLAAGHASGELWAADERGIHRSADGGVVWERVAGFDPTPRYLSGLAVIAD